jgi:hypothetical protein
MHYRTQQGYEPSLRARDQQEQQTWGLHQNALINNNITQFFSDEY